METKLASEQKLKKAKARGLTLMLALLNLAWLLLCQSQAAHTDIRIFTHMKDTCTVPIMLTPAQDTCTHGTGLCPHLSPVSSLVFSIPLCLSPPGLSVGLPSLGEMAMWWERQRLHRATPPEDAGVQQALLFWVGPFPHPPSPTVTTKQQ